MKTARTRLLALALAGLAFSAGQAQARVFFTGYGDLRLNSGLNAQISGAPATLTSFGLSRGGLNSRGFSADSIGLFASTEIQENVQFLMDIAFRNVGAEVNQLRLQYAYLDWKPTKDTAVQVGKVTLPFGYFNQNRFYAFQRYTITAPIFQGGFLGLPLADWGVIGRQRIELPPFNAEADAYLVNGFANISGNKTSLRRASLPGGLVLSNNLGAADNNHSPSVGGRVRLTDIGGLPVETGASYYWGYWDKSGLEPMSLTGAHVHTTFQGFDVLGEFLHMAVRGDQGFAASLGSPNWTTNGGFATVSYDKLRLKGRAVVPFFQCELYSTRPNDGGTVRETVRALNAGANLIISEHIRLKSEYLHFVYELPDAATSGGLRLSADGALFSVVVTF